MTIETQDQQQQYETERPLAPVNLAKEPSREKLAHRLQSEFVMRPEHAAAIARAVVDPTIVRALLDSPLVKRIPGGVVRFVIADVFTPLIATNPANPRERERRAYPIAGDGGAMAKPPTVESDGTNRALVLIGDSPAHLSDLLEQSESYLRFQNPSLGEDLGADGPLEPLTVAVTEFRHRDGADKAVTLTAQDGGTRVSWCHSFTGAHAAAPAYTYPGYDARARRSMLNRVIDVQSKRLDQTTYEDRRSHRALVAQARILIAVEPVRPGAPTPSFLDAVRAIVAEIHVAPPKGWPEGSQMDEIADKVLDLLAERGRITAVERDYYAGMIPPDQLKRVHGLPTQPDVRAAKLVRLFHDGANAGVISAAVRGLGEKKKLANDDKIKLAAELIMRPYRHVYRKKAGSTDGAMSGLRSAVQRVFAVAGGARKLESWDVTSRATDDARLAELRDAALAELAAAGPDADLGPSRLELATLASYWLSATGALRRDTPDDVRSPATIVGLMMKSPMGIHQTFQVVLDGRAEPNNVARKARKVVSVHDAMGEHFVLAERAGGDFEVISDGYLRETYRAADTPAPTPPDQTPTDRMMGFWGKIASASAAVEAGVRDVQSVRDEDSDILAEKIGVPTEAALEVEQRLRDAADEIRDWGRQYRRTHRVAETAREVEA